MKSCLNLRTSQLLLNKKPLIFAKSLNCIKKTRIFGYFRGSNLKIGIRCANDLMLLSRITKEYRLRRRRVLEVIGRNIIVHLYYCTQRYVIPILEKTLRLFFGKKVGRRVSKQGSSPPWQFRTWLLLTLFSDSDRWLSTVDDYVFSSCVQRACCWTLCCVLRMLCCCCPARCSSLESSSSIWCVHLTIYFDVVRLIFICNVIKFMLTRKKVLPLCISNFSFTTQNPCRQWKQSLICTCYKH